MPVQLRTQTRGTATLTVTDFAGRRAVLVQVDLEHNRGLLRSVDGDTIAAGARAALDQGIPIVLMMETLGADINDGVSTLDSWGRAAKALVDCSGRVPIIVAATGAITAGFSLLLGLADLVVMTSDAYAFVSGPQMVEQFTGVGIDRNELGGSGVHGRHSGVAHVVVETVEDAIGTIDDLLALLPQNTDEEPPRWPCSDPVDRLLPDVYAIIPEAATGSYDVRHVIADVVDDGDLLELQAGWAANLVTGLATIAGRPIGVVANQPQTVAGTLDIAASQKGARFVAFCDAFNLPLLTLVDTSGFYPGKDLEWRGMIRYGAQLAFAYARATVPRVNVTLRKSYGGAYIVMDSKYMGNDVAIAWPSAEIAVMGAKGAIEILHRTAGPEEQAALVDAYEARLLNPYIAAERGSVEQVIDPADTRRVVSAAFEILSSKRERLPRRRHDNTPL